MSTACEYCYYIAFKNLIKINDKNLCPSCAQSEMDRISQQEKSEQEYEHALIKGFRSFIRDLGTSMTSDFFKELGLEGNEKLIDFIWKKTSIDHKKLSMLLTLDVDYFPFDREEIKKIEQCRNDLSRIIFEYNQDKNKKNIHKNNIYTSTQDDNKEATIDLSPEFIERIERIERVLVDMIGKNSKLLCKYEDYIDMKKQVKKKEFVSTLK